MNVRRLFCVLSVLLGATAIGSATAAANHAQNLCSRHSGTIKTIEGGHATLWHRGPWVYACTRYWTFSTDPVEVVRVGRWSPRYRYVYDGMTVAWTTPKIVRGRRVDHVWAMNVLEDRRWLNGQQANPDGRSAAAREERVQRLTVAGAGIAWVTAGGSVVGGLYRPVAGLTPAISGGRPAPRVRGQLMMIGRWPGVPVGPLAASLKIDWSSYCYQQDGFVDPNYTYSVRPSRGLAAISVTWGDEFNLFCDRYPDASGVR